MTRRCDPPSRFIPNRQNPSSSGIPLLLKVLRNRAQCRVDWRSLRLGVSMLELLNLLAEHLSRWGLRVSLLLILFNVTARSAVAQDWSWSFEKVDSGAKFTSLAVDKLGSVHVSYTDSSS